VLGAPHPVTALLSINHDSHFVPSFNSLADAVMPVLRGSNPFSFEH
jgi:hypothetical protein